MKENSIEEALEKLSTGKKIKMYELLRTFKREGIENFVITRKKYVDVILSDYKRVLKENEQLRTEVNSLKKENEELKEERQIVGMPVRNKRDGRIGIVLHQWKSGSVAVLESINPRVINTHDSWNTLEIVTDEVKQTQTKCETISVSLVKGKIEELDIEISTCEYADDDSEEYKQEVEKNKAELLIAKKVLQQLLGSDK